MILAQKYKGKSRGRKSKLSLKIILYLYIESGIQGGFLAAKSYHGHTMIPLNLAARGGFRATRKQLSYAPAQKSQEAWVLGQHLDNALASHLPH